jgi:hypothetical protein
MNETRHPRISGRNVHVVNASLTLLTPVFCHALRVRMNSLTVPESALQLIGRIGGDEMSETKRTRNIAFRVTEEDYSRIEK